MESTRRATVLKAVQNGFRKGFKQVALLDATDPSSEQSRGRNMDTIEKI